jgi:hypothetical protein
MTRAFVAALLIAAAAGCGSRAPKMVAPDSIESFCLGPAPRGAAIVSVLSSVADAIQPVDVPSEASLRKSAGDLSGAIAHWKAEPLYMPGTARSLGVDGNYVDVSEVVIVNDLTSPDARMIYATVATPKGAKRVPLLAYDTRNVCSNAPNANDG